MVATVLEHVRLGDLIILFGAFIVGIVAWRSRRGDFYKAVAEEKNAENEQLKIERDRLKRTTDITPIVKTLDSVVQALDRHSKMTEQVFEKVADMNGSLRAHGEAMKALADRLILEEAARGLLEEAAKSRRRSTP